MLKNFSITILKITLKISILRKIFLFTSALILSAPTFLMSSAPTFATGHDIWHIMDDGAYKPMAGCEYDKAIITIYKKKRTNSKKWRVATAFINAAGGDQGAKWRGGDRSYDDAIKKAKKFSKKKHTGNGYNSCGKNINGHRGWP